MKKTKDTRSARLVKLALAGLIAALAVTAGCKGFQLKQQNAQLQNVQIEMRSLLREAENLEMCIAQAYDLTGIGERARELGMTEPDESQLRVVRLPASTNETYALSVANTQGDMAEQ
ncbi:MAG: hypothetical protein E7317_10320 [Clostridiales bacterium]|nr:hypothetical protein [Clostridiales bacterium]